MRILWLKTELLHPVDKGGRIRTYNMLRELRRAHQVTYLALDDGAGGTEARERAAEYCHELLTVPHATRPKFSAGFYLELAQNMVSSLPYFMKKYVSDGMRREVERLTRGGGFDVLVCDFLQPSVNVPRQLPLPAVLFQHNVEAMIWQRHYEVQRNPLKKAYLYGQWLKSRAYEGETCRRFDSVVAVSREDAEVMRRVYGAREVEDVPTGVDTEFFRPRADAGEQRPHELVFTGSMDWLPNEDAIRFFTEQVMPRIKRAVPDVTLTVVGRNPSPWLVELGRRDASVVVTGRVEDVRPYMERAAVYVVPIRVGGGTRLKIYEAMAMAKPVVSTTIGAEGLPVRDGEEILIADEAEAFASAVVRLLEDDAQARALGERGATLVRERFGWARVAEKFAEICERAIEVRAAGRQETQTTLEEEARASM